MRLMLSVNGLSFMSFDEDALKAEGLPDLPAKLLCHLIQVMFVVGRLSMIEFCFLMRKCLLCCRPGRGSSGRWSNPRMASRLKSTMIGPRGNRLRSCRKLIGERSNLARVMCTGSLLCLATRNTVCTDRHGTQWVQETRSLCSSGTKFQPASNATKSCVRHPTPQNQQLNHQTTTRPTSFP